MEGIRENCVFKLYKVGGKVRLMLRLSLPKIDGDSEGVEGFNAYYARLLSDAVGTVESHFNKEDDTSCDSSGYLALDVSFTKEEANGSLVIRRFYTLRRGAQTLSKTSVADVFSKDLTLAKNLKML